MGTCFQLVAYHIPTLASLFIEKELHRKHSNKPVQTIIQHVVNLLKTLITAIVIIAVTIEHIKQDRIKS